MAKMTPDDQKRFLDAALEEQRHLLRKSIVQMAAGDLAEALRIATCIRVLVHETAASKPLLKQLKPNYLDLEVLDRKPEPEEKLPPGVYKAVVLSFPVRIKIQADGKVFLNPELDDELFAPSILGKWWERPCLIIPGLGGFSRREFVLGLSNKEGGAHVDPDIPKRYQQLLGYQALQIGANTSITALNVSRFMTGQAGVELLDCLDRNFPQAA